MTKYTRKNPYIAKLKRTEILTGDGSEKDTRHYEIDLTDSGMEFLPGDSLAVLPTNCTDLVEEILGLLGFSGEEIVPNAKKEETTLRNALTSSYAITTPDKKLLASIAEKSDDSELAGLLDSEKKKELADYLWGREVIDFLIAHPTAKFDPTEFVGLLKKLQVRLYSIASSLAARPGEVHLTVAAVTYDSYGRTRKGVCSSFLSDRIDNDTPIPCFITPGKGFRLPDPEENVPIIMCGPGTGIAPFRAFLQERGATKAKGKAWLFFGEQHESSDFFYKEEYEAALESGVLTQLTTAFSRDQAEKIYVQHRMLEHSAQLYEWLEEGAIFYVCGDAARMAVDVDSALHQIIAKEGDKSDEEAAAYVEEMRTAKRYRRDVY